MPPASNVKLYIPPHGIAHPFEFVVYPQSSATKKSATVELPPLLSRLDALVRDLHQVPAAAELETPGESISAPEPHKWLLFCPARLTLIARSEVVRFLEMRARDNIKEVSYIILPLAACFWRDFLGLLQAAFPTQIPHATVQAMRSCAVTQMNGRNHLNGDNNSCCHHSLSKDNMNVNIGARFHLDGIRYPWLYASSHMASELGQYHVAIWLPGITLPFDLILPTQGRSGLSSALEGLITVTLAEMKSKPSDTTLSALAQSGYFPTAQNWMLVDFKSQSLFHKTSAADLHFSASSSQTYAVIPIQYSRLVKGMIDAVKQDGPQGWATFWVQAVGNNRRGTTQLPLYTPGTSVACSEYGDEE